MAARKNNILTTSASSLIRAGKSDAPSVAPAKQCGLCGKTRKLVKTECCDNRICDDEENYVMFSYARNSCSRNHRNQSLCSYHFGEEHKGNWWECQKCPKEFPLPYYVWLGTNEYNFRKLENPPEFEPIRCAKCAKAINLGTDGYTMRGEDYLCESCGFLPLRTASPRRKRLA